MLSLALPLATKLLLFPIDVRSDEPPAASRRLEATLAEQVQESATNISLLVAQESSSMSFPNREQARGLVKTYECSNAVWGSIRSLSGLKAAARLVLFAADGRVLVDNLLPMLSVDQISAEIVALERKLVADERTRRNPPPGAAGSTGPSKAMRAIHKGHPCVSARLREGRPCVGRRKPAGDYGGVGAIDT